MRIRAVVAAVATLLILPIAACAPDQATATPDLPKKDVAKWVMPLDEYASPALGSLANYASNLLIARCLGEDGIDWPIPWQTTDEAAYMPPTANMSGFPNLTSAIAREYGYRAPSAPGEGGGPTADGVATLKKLNAIAASTPGFDPLFNACMESARKKYADDKAVAIENQLNAWVWPAADAAARTDSVKQAAQRWQSCLRDAGYPVDLTAPIDAQADETMPSRALQQQLGIPPRWQAGDGAPENPLIQTEIDLAVADADCRESSGWTNAMYEAMWDEQVKTVSKNADELVRIRERNDTLLADALTIIADHAPKK